MNFNGSTRPYDLFWLYQWIEGLSRKAMAVRVRDNLLAAIGRSERSRRIWQAENYAGIIAGWMKEDPGHRKQRR